MRTKRLTMELSTTQLWWFCANTTSQCSHMCPFSNDLVNSRYAQMTYAVKVLVEIAVHQSGALAKAQATEDNVRQEALLNVRILAKPIFASAERTVLRAALASA